MRELKELQKLLDAQKADFQKFSRKFYFIAAAVFMSLAFAVVLYPKSGTPPSWHDEIVPSNALSYIKGGELVALPDGDYPLAMPPDGTFVSGVAPMLLVQVNGTYYPLNIVDDSIIPRRGKLLPLKILFGFTSKHAENTLHYKEKTGDDPVADYRRKAFYYLRVKDGFGKVQRGFEIKF
ncbi:MAG: hypothetical protein IJP42_02550 [Selenomonadaceae bacterium]|nr:hypothetical protein [Selenomonadaceae bacterium]MBQ6757951.1 hypothetical protein [Selenomonadaceae bacterium]MBR0103623.1 hypothetical protein [Selenomonadaceae bacterium]